MVCALIRSINHRPIGRSGEIDNDDPIIGHINGLLEGLITPGIAGVLSDIEAGGARHSGIHLRLMKPCTLLGTCLLILSGLALNGCSRSRVPTHPYVYEPGPTTSTNDPFLWLEDVTNTASLEWARAQNAISTEELTNSPSFEPLRQRFLSILDSKERIPMVQQLGSYLYNFWRDEQHVRGVFRRTTMEEYRKSDPDWETVLDLDALADAEKENWVWKGFDALYPDYDRCLISLSRGGADATVLREFDLKELTFVTDGFVLPEAKMQVSWRDRNSLYVGTDFGEGSLTDSGYPRLAKLWKRGTPLSEATLVFEGKPTDLMAAVIVNHDRGRTYEFVYRAITFYSNEMRILRGDTWTLIDKPADAEVSTFADQLLLTLRSDWTVGDNTYAAGALLATDLESYMDGLRSFQVLFQPTPRKSLAGVSGTQHHLLINELDEVKNHLVVATTNGAGSWDFRPLDAPGIGTVNAWGVDPDKSDEYWMTVTDFLTPSSLYLGTLGAGAPQKLKSLPDYFETQGLKIEQYQAPSTDGTLIPYFLVGPENLKRDGQTPTLLYGYGGFEISMLSRYSATVGAAWLEKGYVYVLANTRGGGEFGPLWHQAALKAKRQTAYDDFISVAEDLIRRGITCPQRLGIMGGSNGGLLMGNMLVQRPDLFGAIVCQVPLLDMRRYHLLLAGASWMGEFGNPDDPNEWEFLRRYSPYHNVRSEVVYPRTLFTTSTRDDRVHPAHARKMVAKMFQQGHDVLYYENIEGGHGGAANNPQQAFMQALAFTFLQQELTRPLPLEIQQAN